MDYASGHTEWNKLVRDNIPTSLEAKGVKTSFRIITSSEELIVLLGNKLCEEMDELESAITGGNQDNILEEAADVKEVHEKLFQLLKEYTGDEMNGFDKLINNMGRAEWKINAHITQQNQEIIKKLKTIQTKKREEKGGFEKGIFLISTDS